MQSRVLSCQVNECGYNDSKECRAPVVYIGSDHAACDTFTEVGVPQLDAEPKIASCHIDECRFNEQMACNASGIDVARHQQHADCGTFLPG